MTEIICAAIAAVASVLVTVVGVKVNKMNKHAERHADLRQQEMLLSLRMMDATLQLSVVTSNALTGGRNNGNVKNAREAAQKVAEDYEYFMKNITAHEIAK